MIKSQENKLSKAINFAISAHEGAMRKGRKIPYIIHPLEVLCIAVTMTSDTDVLCASVLHDVLEDTDATAQDIKENFGQKILDLVAAESEYKAKDKPACETWKQRKTEALRKLMLSDDKNIKIIALADKLSNMRSLYCDYQTEGENIWLKFNQRQKSEQKWYYDSMASALKELKDTLAYKEYTKLLKQVFD